jgi:hypothetical protein
LLAAASIISWAPGRAAAQATEDAAEADAESPADATPPEDETVLPAPKLPDPEGARALPPPDRVWYDPDQHLVYVDGYVSLREGMLEMFACLVGTKEHESVVAVNTRAQSVHTALLRVGAVAGHPVQYKPRFAPPEGTEIEIEVRWLDAAGQWLSAPAQEWVRDVETKKPMKLSWVFAGSGFWTDEATGRSYYMAETGDFICVSNFTTALLDVPIESSQSNEGLLFQANSDAIPELGTPVRLVLKPVLEEEEGAEERSEDASE